MQFSNYKVNWIPFAFNFPKLGATVLGSTSTTGCRHAPASCDEDLQPLQLSAYDVRGRKAEVHRALNLRRGNTMLAHITYFSTRRKCSAPKLRLCRTPIIQHASSCFTAHRPEAGRVQGTDLALSADQACELMRLWQMSDAVRLLQVLQLSPGGCFALGGAC